MESFQRRLMAGDQNVCKDCKKSSFENDTENKNAVVSFRTQIILKTIVNPNTFLKFWFLFTCR